MRVVAYGGGFGDVLNRGTLGVPVTGIMAGVWWLATYHLQYVERPPRKDAYQ